MRGGPDAIRLHAVASEMGVTHQAILRHFRTRDQLIASLLRHAGKGLRDELSTAIAAPGPPRASVRTFYDAIDRVYRKRGYARLSAGLVLRGQALSGSGLHREAAEAIHRTRRRARSETAPPAVLEDTLCSIVLLSLVAWADALVGSAMRRAVDLPDDERSAQRFRVWVETLVDERLFGRAGGREQRRVGRAATERPRIPHTSSGRP
jgi:AcrR family transcriptional regulator